MVAAALVGKLNILNISYPKITSITILYRKYIIAALHESYMIYNLTVWAYVRHVLFIYSDKLEYRSKILSPLKDT